MHEHRSGSRVVQTRAETDDPPKNVQRALAYVRAGGGARRRIVCLPETFPVPGRPRWTTTRSRAAARRP